MPRLGVADPTSNLRGPRGRQSGHPRHHACIRADDLLKASPEHAPVRPRVGIAPRPTDAELVTLAVMQALLGRTSEARWLRYARAELRHLFPYLPQQPGYNKAAVRPGRHAG